MNDEHTNELYLDSIEAIMLLLMQWILSFKTFLGENNSWTKTLKVLAKVRQFKIRNKKARFDTKVSQLAVTIRISNVYCNILKSNNFLSSPVPDIFLLIIIRGPFDFDIGSLCVHARSALEQCAWRQSICRIQVKVIVTWVVAKIALAN